MAITFTVDLEDHLNLYASDGRWAQNTRRLLDFCTAQNLRGTFFAVGKVAAAAPGLLKDIVKQGHELALHSYDHIALTQEDPKTWGAKLEAAKKKFEDITGKQILGFRAPVFSLTPKSAWALEDLTRLGFVYSSSVIPGQGVFSGWPGAPRAPFRWKQGIIEVPVPVLPLGGFALPFLGGIYLRYLPLALVKPLEAANQRLLLWTYSHPYDIDGEEGFVRLDDGTPLWANLLLMSNRGGFLKKLEKLLKTNGAQPLIERVTDRDFPQHCPLWPS